MNAAVQIKRDKFVSLLKQLFQMDQPELDFGLYRIMHAKSDEINQYLENELPAEISSVLTTGTDTDAEKINDRTAENVFDALYRFFSRYYSGGDFLSKRVYKENVYAIPYEGEEVKLYWANQDQYYVKTSEYLHDYAFCLNTGTSENPRRVHFRLREVTQGEHNNVKADSKDTRFFVLSADNFAEEKDGELTLWFEYRPVTASDNVSGKTIQNTFIERAVEQLKDQNHPLYYEWFRELLKDDPSTRSENKKAIIEKQLINYTARNTFDYFIHKDLKTFLTRELDFYIKNEIMHLDDLEKQDAPQVESYLNEIKVIRKIAKKLIEFLAQLEDFQKGLWLKKKFVVETNYCITLDRIPEEFYAEIAANEEQRKEWERLYSIDKVETGPSFIEKPYTVPLTVEYLGQNQNLVVDTKFYSQDFKERLIGSIDNLDEQCNGLLVHSENFQALNLLQRRYQEQVKCVYIDPPYNTAASEILYKNNYKHSTWLSLIYGNYSTNRIVKSRHSRADRQGQIAN